MKGRNTAILQYVIKTKKPAIIISVGLFIIIFVFFYVLYNNEITAYLVWTNSWDPSITIFSLLVPIFIAIALLRREWEQSLEWKLIVHYTLQSEDGSKQYIMSFYNASLLENADIRAIGQQFGRQVADKNLDFNPAIKPQKEAIVLTVDENNMPKWIKYFEIVFQLQKDPFEKDEKLIKYKNKYIVSNLMYEGPKEKVVNHRPNQKFDEIYSTDISLSELLSTSINAKRKFNDISNNIELTNESPIINKIPKIYLLNSSVITAAGQYTYQFINKEIAKEYLKNAKEIEMAIAYESTAKLLSQLLEIETTTNRDSIQMQTNEAAIILKPKKRLEEIKTLSIEELERVGYELGWMVKVG